MTFHLSEEMDVFVRHFWVWLNKFPYQRQTFHYGSIQWGHFGALVLALRNQERYQSVSVSPILSPSLSCLGEVKLTAFLKKIEKMAAIWMPAHSYQQGYKVQGMRRSGLRRWVFANTITHRRFYRNLSCGKSTARCVSTKATIIAITLSPVLLVSILPIMRHFEVN